MIPATRTWWWALPVTLSLLAGIVWVSPRLAGSLVWLANLAFCATIVALVGYVYFHRWSAFLIDVRNRISLARLQWSLWALLILSGYLTAWTVNLQLDLPLDVAISGDLIAVLAITTLSGLLAPTLLRVKERRRADAAERRKSLEILEQRGHGYLDRDSDSVVLRYTSLEGARASDLILGEEVGTAASVDPFKLQLLLVTTLVAVGYGWRLNGIFTVAPGPLEALPKLGLEMLGLLGMSNAAYLAGKLLPRSREPRPEVVTDTSHEPVSEEANVAVEVETLGLTNLRSFIELELELPRPSPAGEKRSGQWVLLLGDNGVGKSTILRGLALALVEPTVATALLETRKTPVPFVRLNTEKAEIAVKLAGMDRFRVEILPGQRSERIRTLEAGAQRPAVFAYGPQRGSAVGRSSREVSFSPVGAVETLFREDAELIHAETWLGKLQLGALKSRGGRAEAFFDAVMETLLALLHGGVERLEVTADGVRASGPAVGQGVPLAALSDGYLSTMGWILDLLARWSHRFERIEGRPPGKSMAAEAKGLVVIDEIGLHLHPSWQTEAVRKVREVFPNMTFFASSHQPLVLVGAEPGEVLLLKRAETGRVTVEQAPDPRLLTGSELYASFFQVQRLYPDALGEKLDQYARLAVNPYRSNKEERQVHELLKELRAEKVDVKLEPVARLEEGE